MTDEQRIEEIQRTLGNFHKGSWRPVAPNKDVDFLLTKLNEALERERLAAEAKENQLIKRRAYFQRPDVKEKHRVYQQRPEVKEKQRIHYKAKRLIEHKEGATNE